MQRLLLAAILLFIMCFRIFYNIRYSKFPNLWIFMKHFPQFKWCWWHSQNLGKKAFMKNMLCSKVSVFLKSKRTQITLIRATQYYRLKKNNIELNIYNCWQYLRRWQEKVRQIEKPCLILHMKYVWFKQ